MKLNPPKVYRLYKLGIFVTPMGRTGSTWYWKESGECGNFDLYSDNQQIIPKGHGRKKHPFPPSNVIQQALELIQKEKTR